MTKRKIKRIVIPGIVILLLVNFSLIAKKREIEISTTEVIAASNREVFELIKQLERFPEWSPFLVTDPNQKNYVTGENGEIGSKFYWEGVDEKSEGIQTLVALENDSYVKMECTITKPFKGNPVFEYHIRSMDDQVELVQDFTLRLSGFAYLITKIFGVEAKMVETNKIGLQRLKVLLESNKSITQN